MLDRIRELAGSSLEKTENLSAEGRITPAKGRFHLTLLVRDGRDVRKRVINSDSCGDLAGAAAITLALLLGIDVSAAEPRAGDQTPGAAAPKGGASGQDRQTAPSERRREDRGSRSDERGREDRGARSDEPTETSPAPSQSAATRRWNLLVRAPILAADLGPLPNPSLGAGLGVGVRLDSWRVLLAGHVYSGQTVDTVGWRVRCRRRS